MSANPLAAAVCFGSVMHARGRPSANAFRYPIAYLRLPLSRLEQVRVPLLGIERPNVFCLRRADHGARDGTPLLPWIRSLLERHGLAGEANGEVVLQTMPRMFGFVFNPVSFWFCHDREGRLRVVLAEVSNTFGERHNYLVHHPDLRPIESDDELFARKVFHVSPFFPVSGRYRFRFERGEGLESVSIDYLEGDRMMLATRLDGCAQPLDGRATQRWLLRLPFMTLGVVARIHWQALRLWMRKVPFYRKPAPPLEETT